MSTENEAGSVQPAAESAAVAREGAASDGAQAPAAPSAAPSDAPPVPSAPPAPASSAAAPASAAADPRLAGEPRTEALPLQAPPPVGPPSPYGAPPSEPAGRQTGAYDSAKQAYGSADGPAAPAEPPAPQPAHAPQPAPPAHPAQPAPPASPYANGAAGTPGPGPVPDPFAVPATPAYASGGAYGGTSAPQPEGGSGGGGGPIWGAPLPSGDGSGSGAGPGGLGSGPGSGGRRRGVGALAAAVVVAALVAGGVGGGIGYEVAKHNNDNSGSTTISAPSSIKALDRAPNSVAGIANRALPSVVTIKASGSQESGTGTGFVYDTQGHILTNNHVVAPAADGGKLTVTFSNGNTYDAEVVGRAQGYDVAVVKLKSASGVKLTPLPLGNSDDARVGDATIAIGAPFGLSGTVTTGIVSAVHRPVASSDGQGSSPASYMSAIQTDASINPGNSGGPLLNANGAVIGINSAIQPAGNTSPGSQGGSVGLGFAIPINQAKRVADQLIKTGQPVYPVMKVQLDTQYDGDGARIGPSADDVTPGGPGAQAGLKPGDIITKFDGTIVDSGQTLIGEIWTHSPGDKVTVTYTRDGSTHTTTVTLGSRVGDSTN